jgi:hypothetical protein
MEHIETSNNGPKKATSITSSFSDKKQVIQKLRTLCSQLDPFSPLSPENESFLRQIGIKDLENPYELTNQLVKMMEDLIEDSEANN